MRNLKSLRIQIEDLKREIQELKDNNSIGVILKQQLDYQDNQTWFRTIFEQSRLGNIIISNDYKIFQVNASTVNILEFDKKEEIIGTHILDYAPVEAHHNWRTLQIKLWEKRIGFFTLETCLNKKDSSTIWCNITSVTPPKNRTVKKTKIRNFKQEDEKVKNQRSADHCCA